MKAKADRLKGGIYGLLVGDAVGVPCGTWSDDGAQALCLLDSLLEKGEFDLKDFADKLAEWWYHGYRAVDNKVFDIGEAKATER